MLAGSQCSDFRTLCLSRQQPGRMPDLAILTRAVNIHMRHIIRLCHVSTHLRCIPDSKRGNPRSYSMWIRYAGLIIPSVSSALLQCSRILLWLIESMHSSIR